MLFSLVATAVLFAVVGESLRAQDHVSPTSIPQQGSRLITPDQVSPSFIGSSHMLMNEPVPSRPSGDAGVPPLEPPLDSPAVTRK